MSTSAARPRTRPTEVGAEPLAQLAQAVLALRSTRDLWTACFVAGPGGQGGLGAVEHRLLRVDARSGTLRLLEASGIETPYLAEEDGPVERVLRHETALFEGGFETSRLGETLLWARPPAALAALPLFSGNELIGCLLLNFPVAQPFDSGQRLSLQILADALALALDRADLHRLLDDECTRRAELERRLDAGEESSSSLMSVVAHEIRTPLTAIKAYTESLIDSLGNPRAPRERFLGIIHDECDRLGQLVTDILDLSRLEAGRRPLRLARFAVSDLIQEVIVQLQPLATLRQITVDREGAADLVAEADTDLIRRLLATLVGNAIKASPIGGRVRVHSRMGAEEWEAAVEDDGPGIAAEMLPRVFERCFRGARSEESAEGVGLGLALARSIVELHGGRMWVDSPGGRGARFCLAMPKRQTASTKARHIARCVVGRPDLRTLLDHTVEMVSATMDAEIVSLMLVDPDRGDLFVAASRGFEGKNLSLRRTLVRSGVAGTVAAWGRPVLVNNIETDRRFQRINHPQYSTKSLLSVPLRVEGEILGVINVNNKASREAFNDDDLTVLTALVERVGGAVERAYAYPDSGRTVDEASGAIRSITQLKRDGLLGTRSSVGMARGLARELEMSPGERDVIGYVATIHDIGMSPIHSRLMKIPGPLGADDRQTLMQHPEVGVEMIRPLEYLGSVRDLILSHHERWDGTGYPRGLAGHEIPLGARILAVVDAYASMTAGRSYRPPRAHAEAIRELRAEAGRQFDPEVVEAFIRLLEKDRDAA